MYLHRIGSEYYWANCELIQPEDKGVTWGDVREYRVDGEHYYYTEKALQWLAKSSQKRGKTLDIWLEDEKAQMLEECGCTVAL